jgi:hypothetical protein
MNTREIGRKLEQFIVNKFQEIGIKSSLSKNSGANGQAGDVNTEYFITECKQKNVESISVNAKVWQKLVELIPLHSKRLPLYVLGNKDNKVWCVTDVNTMFELIKGWLDNKNRSFKC